MFAKRNRWSGGSAVGYIGGEKNVIEPALIGLDVHDQARIDRCMIELDGTCDKSRLGGNSIYGVSLACLLTAARCDKKEVFEYLSDKPISQLPLPTTHCFYSVSGGMQIQECSFIPYQTESMIEAVELLAEVYRQIPNVIRDYTHGACAIPHPSTSWLCPSDDPATAFSLINDAAKRVGAEDRILFAMDVAANELYDEARGYRLNGRVYKTEEWINYLDELTQRYPFLYIEDPLAEDDWDGWALAHKRLHRTNLIGDDFIATSAARIQRAACENACDGFVLKPNQAGTVTEALEAFDAAKQAGFFCVSSVRAGGVASDIAAEFAVGLGCVALKNGPPISGKQNTQLGTLMRAASLYPEAKLFDPSRLMRTKT